MAKRLFLIDGTALAYRSFFAFQGTGRSPLTTKDGHPTAATYGFCTTLRALIEREQPDAMAIAFDGPRGDLLRTKIYPEYKSTRTKMPDEMAMQLDDIREAVDSYGLQVVAAESHEADDVIGTLTRQAEAAGLPVVIASSDKDFFQLINPNVHLLNPNDKTDTLWQAEQVRAKTGVEPAQIIDWLSLVGDAVDGIPGVRGVGPKTATKLLLEYGTAENLYSNLNVVKPDGVQGRLREATTEVQRNQELVALREIPEWKIKLEELRPGAGDYATLHAKYTRWNFRSLLQELEAGRQGELL